MKKLALIILLSLAACNKPEYVAPKETGELEGNNDDVNECPRSDGQPCK